MRRRRGRATPDVPSAPEVPPAPAGEGAPFFSRYTLHVLPDPDVEKPYFHGHIDGAFNGDAEAYTQYLDHRMAWQDLDRQVGEGQAAAERLGATLEQVLGDTAEVARRTSVTHALEESRRRHVGEAEAADSEHQTLVREHEETRERGSVLHMGLYTLAGLAFLFGDIIVSFEVVSQALKIGTGKGIMVDIERWGFAIAIAALTFVIKVAYERMVEKPYWEGRKGWFKAIILVTSTVVLFGLGAMGVLRANYVTETNALLSSGTSAFSLTEETVPESVGTPGEEGPTGLHTIVFTLTSVLFALAGAICFSVAAANGHDYWSVRRPLRKRLYGKARFAEDGAIIVGVWTPPNALRVYHKSAAERAQRQLDDEAVQLSLLRARLAGCETAETLRAKVQQAEADLAEKRRLALVRRVEAATAAYRSGLALARANSGDLRHHAAGHVSGDGYAPHSRHTSGDGAALDLPPAWDIDTPDLADVGLSSAGDGAMHRGRRLRPFLQLRREIARTSNQ